MVTVQVAEVPERVARTAASSSIIFGAPEAILSIVIALTEQAILAVEAIADFTLIVKLTTNEPPKVVGG
jgi:hypothetical protein